MKPPHPENPVAPLTGHAAPPATTADAPAGPTIALLTFLSVWNDFLWPLVVTSSPNTMTIQLGLATFQSAHFTRWPELMAGTVMSQLPVLILFIVGQRFFVSSIANTGIK